MKIFNLIEVWELVIVEGMCILLLYVFGGCLCELCFDICRLGF